jgi:hypothetical protein
MSSWLLVAACATMAVEEPDVNISLTAEQAVKIVALAKDKNTERFDDETWHLLQRMSDYAGLFVGKPTSVFTDALGPPEGAWGVPVPPNQLRWEIGRTPETKRSGAPMLVVEFADETITDVRVALPM